MSALLNFELPPIIDSKSPPYRSFSDGQAGDSLRLTLTVTFS